MEETDDKTMGMLAMCLAGASLGALIFLATRGGPAAESSGDGGSDAEDTDKGEPGEQEGGGEGNEWELEPVPEPEGEGVGDNLPDQEEGEGEDEEPGEGVGDNVVDDEGGEGEDEFGTKCEDLTSFTAAQTPKVAVLLKASAAEALIGAGATEWSTDNDTFYLEAGQERRKWLATSVLLNALYENGTAMSLPIGDTCNFGDTAAGNALKTLWAQAYLEMEGQ